MPLAAIPAIVAASGIAAGGSIAGGLIAKSGANKAATTQAQAAKDAATLQHEDNTSALDFQKQQLSDTQALESPYTTAGAGAVTNLASLLGVLSPSQLASPAPPSAADLATQTGGPGAGSSQTPVASKPAGVSDVMWNNLGPYQRLALAGSYSGQSPDTSKGVPVVGGKPPNISQQDWNSLPKSQQSALLNVGKPAAPVVSPAGTTSTGAPSTTLGSLVNPSLGAPGSLSKGFDQTFTAPTDVTEQNDPGFKFRMEQGQQALERSAAARGGLLSGGNLKDLTDYAQGTASNEYANVYNRALQQFQQSYNIFNNNQTNQYNRLANLAGLGQTSTSQLGGDSLTAGGQVANTLLVGGQQQGQALNNAAAATASGYVGGANAIGGALSNSTNALSQGVLLNTLLGNRPTAGTTGGYTANPGAQDQS